VAATTLSRELDVEIFYAKTTASAKQALAKYVTSSLDGHSCEREVSEALYLAPHLVHQDRLEKGEIREGNWKWLRPGNAIQGPYLYEEMTVNGCIGEAPKASIEAGRAIVEEALDRLSEALGKVLGIQVGEEVKSLQE
jgi:creatinine amidohydrolase